MFTMNWTEPAEIAGTIHLERRPMALGNITDLDGKRWNIRAILHDHVRACPAEALHPYYSDTSGRSHGFVSQDWQPYRVEINPPEGEGR